MPDKQYYETSVSKQDSQAVLHDLRGNEQSIQPFTQTPAAGQPGFPINEGLCPHELFSLYTAQIIKEKKIFTR